MKESKTAVSNTAPKPIIPPSCLGEFEWPQVGEFEVAIRVDYFEWAREVVDGCRFAHNGLARIFDELYGRREQIAQ